MIALFVRVLLCILIFGLFLYSYINKQNQITELRLKIPVATKELQAIEQENVALQYEVDRFESPSHLMQLARKPQFSHLKHPCVNEIIIIQVPEKP